MSRQRQLVLPDPRLVGSGGPVQVRPRSHARRHGQAEAPVQVNAALGMVVLGVALLPFLTPKGPGHSAPVDIALMLAIVTVILWAGVTRSRLHVPYVVPVAGLVLVGCVSALLSDAPSAGGIAVAQEIFLLAWCAAVTSVCRTPGALRVVVRAWCLSATTWATFLVAAVVAGQPGLAGVAGGAGGRARLLFDHPNMAGNYFLISILVIIAAGYPRRAPVRALACSVLFVAMVLAGSNAALLSLALVGLALLFLRLRSRSGLITATAVVLCVLFVGGAVWTVAAQPVMSAIEETDNTVVRYSVSRGPRSADARQMLFAAQYELFREGHLLGVGPAGTREALDESPSALVKESHNDYLATLVERGPLGVLALLLLIGAVAVRAASVGRPRLSAAYAAVIPRPGALAGAFVVFAFSAITHEVLHYRHLWTLLAILAALYLFGRRDARTAPTGPAVPDIDRTRRPPPTVAPFPADGR
ncbi:MAG: O-antigen ligase family protein [Actinomycetes bacterium]